MIRNFTTARALRPPPGPSQKPLRVALVTEFYYPHFGGVTEHVQNLAVHLRAWGHTAVVVTSRMAGQRESAGVHRVGRSVVILSNGSFARVTVGLGLRKQIRDIFRRERIDLVHVHGPLTPTLGLSLAIPLMGIVVAALIVVSRIRDARDIEDRAPSGSERERELTAP